MVMSDCCKWTDRLGLAAGLARWLQRAVLLSLLTIGNLAHADRIVPSIAGGWINIDSGTPQFFNTPEDLCGGVARYEGEREATCPDYRYVPSIYGVLAYA